MLQRRRPGLYTRGPLYPYSIWFLWKPKSEREREIEGDNKRERDYRRKKRRRRASWSAVADSFKLKYMRKGRGS